MSPMLYDNHMFCPTSFSVTQFIYCITRLKVSLKRLDAVIYNQFDAGCYRSSLLLKNEKLTIIYNNN
jgi:phosphotransferase system IIB component